MDLYRLAARTQCDACLPRSQVSECWGLTRPAQQHQSQPVYDGDGRGRCRKPAVGGWKPAVGGWGPVGGGPGGGVNRGYVTVTVRPKRGSDPAA